MARKLIEKCYPNAHGWLKLVHDTSCGMEWDEEGEHWYVRQPRDEDEDDWTRFATLDEAKAFYDERKTFWCNEPNWEAQAKYDEAHGTDNGYAPWQLNREY